MAKQQITAEDVLRAGSPWNEYEIWDGLPMVREPSGGRSDAVAARVAGRLVAHVEARGLGWCFLSSQGFLLTRRPDRLLASDTAFVSKARLPTLPERGFVPLAPDFCIEVTSPTERWEGTIEKCGIWIAHGAQCVWAVHPDTSTVAVFRGGQEPEVHVGTGRVDAAPALPGFAVDIGDLFRGM